MNDPSARLVVEGVHKRLGAAEVLRGVSFTMAPGEIVALLGPSGSGKTTLLRQIAGLDHPDRGRIALGDDVLFDGAGKVAVPAERRRIGLVFQSYALWPHRTVQENVAYGLRLRGVPAPELRARVERVLGQLGLGALGARYPHQLSGGQQQRVALARALVYDPRLLLLDEPLSNLDAKLREEARGWLRELIRRLGMAAVMVTHDQAEALAVASRIVLLERGVVAQEGGPEEIYERPGSLFVAEFMGTNNRLAGVLAERDGAAGRVLGDGFELRGTLREEVAPGAPAVALVRLERTRLLPAAAEGAIPATLETALYLGDRWDCLFRAGPARLRLWSDRPPPEGPCWLGADPSAVWIFRAPAADEAEGRPDGVAPERAGGSPGGATSEAGRAPPATMELFHALAEPESAAARTLVRDLGLLEEVAFRNVAFETHAAALAAHGGARTPALWDGARLHEGLAAIRAVLGGRAPPART